VGSTGDFFGAFKGGLTPGPTEPGTWRNHERFGRLQGTGEAVGEIDLPKGKVALGVEDHMTVSDLDVELTGADGEVVGVKRRGDHHDSERAVHNLDRIGEAEVDTPGLHKILIRSPDSGEELVVTAGRDLTFWEMVVGTFSSKPFGER